MTTNNQSRRELLRIGAYAGGAAIVAAGAGIASIAKAEAAGANRYVDRQAWDRSFATYQRAKAHHATFGGVAELSKMDDAMNDAAEAACEVECDAMGALMKLPAPDHAALLFKLENSVFEDGEGKCSVPYSWDYIAQTVADARRLLGRGA